MMRSAVVVSALIFAAPAAASECEALTAQVVERAGVTVVKFPSPNEAILRDGDVTINLGCKGRTLNAEPLTVFPAARFFTLVGEIGGLLTGAPATSIEAAARKCQQRAMKGAGSATEQTPKANVDCLFVRGAQSYVLVLPRR
jgi:hypothetical protein